MLHRTLTLAMVLTLSLAMGCTTVQKWAAGGAVLGAAAGGAWGAHGGGALNAGEGAAVGAAAGGLLGALAGDYFSEKEYNEELEKRDAEIAKLQEENRGLQSKLQAAEEELKVAKRKIADLQTQVDNLTDELAKCKGSRIELTLLADVLFSPGKARLTDEGRKALDGAIQKIKANHSGSYITVEGHTDSDPIRVSGWKDNWDLGSARALAVLRYLVDNGIDAGKSSAETFGSNHPVADNATKDGKKQNRRAVIVIHSGWPRNDKN